jgi:hypothetical protein
MKIFEIYNQLLESKSSELQALNILKRGGVEDAEYWVKTFASADESKNQKNTPIMAYFFAEKLSSFEDIIDIVNEYNSLLIKNRVKPIQISKGKLTIGNREIDGFDKFYAYINGELIKYHDKDVSGGVKSKNKPLWSGNNIDVYKGDSSDKCFEYVKGGLTGRVYTFCIRHPNTYRIYREYDKSTFYFIVDKNKFGKNEDGSINLDNPLHLVVFDVQKGGIELTDADNETGIIGEPFGKDVKSYIDYLKSNGVPVDKMVNIDKTEEEQEEEEIVGKKNNDLEWFMKLPMKYKSAYILQGHTLTNDQFDYLIGD